MPRYATIAIDSLSEMGRLTFSKDMGKHARDLEKIRQLNNWPGATERINMLVRRIKDYKDRGIETVIIAHEQVERFYIKGSGIAGKGEVAEAPYAVKGLPDIPGKQAPEEVVRACDNVFRVRMVNSVPHWITVPESMGGGDAQWVVKDRFGASRLTPNKYLPADFEKVKQLALTNPEVKLDFELPYVWLIYGAPGLGKTRSLMSFPKPIIIFDIDRGTDSIKRHIDDVNVIVKQYNSEEADDYARFLTDLEAAYKV
jgi:hypothetical protein